MSTKVIFLTGSGNWIVPTDWNNGANSVQAIGGGGAGCGSSGSAGAGGGGGAYAKVVNIVLGLGASIPYSAGTGGIGIVGGTGGSGTDSIFNTTSLIAKGGHGGSSSILFGAGGLASACTPSSGAFSGGNGGVAGAGSGDGGGGGGGGAGGPNGTGAVGGIGGSSSNIGGGGGGGAGDGGGAGSNATQSGGNGGTAFDSTVGGAGGASGNPPIVGGAGSHGSGGGGGGGPTTNLVAGGTGGLGGNGIDWTQTSDSAIAGPGGGGGGAGGKLLGLSGTGGSAGNYGGGGGGAGTLVVTAKKGGDGANGIIIITYTTAEPLTGVYIERMADRILTGGALGQDGLENSWFVDSGLSRTVTTPTSTFYGGEHLAGKTIVGLADEVPIDPFVMPIDGTFTLPNPVTSTLIIGLAYTADLETLDLDVGDPTIQSKVKKIPAVTVRLAQATVIKIGPDFNDLTVMKDTVAGNVASTLTGLNTSQVVPSFLPFGDARTFLGPSFSVTGRYCIRQDQPLPVTVLGVFPWVNPGDDRP